jgi:hypothetical protein
MEDGGGTTRISEEGLVHGVQRAKGVSQLSACSWQLQRRII